jgi:hypothetical protein
MTAPNPDWTDRMSDVAALAGISEDAAHKVLVAAGMRTADKRPSELALKNGLARRRGMGLFSEWNIAKTADCLRTVAHQRTSTPETDTQPHGSPKRAGKRQSA